MGLLEDKAKEREFINEIYDYAWGCFFAKKKCI